MIYTEGFCTECICNVALSDTSPQAKRFVDVGRHSKMNEMLIGENGRCFHCGKPGLVVYYIIDETKQLSREPSEPLSLPLSPR